MVTQTKPPLPAAGTREPATRANWTRTWRHVLSDGHGAAYLFLALFLALLLFPLVYLISSSFKESQYMFEYPFRLIAERITFENYLKAWQSAIKNYLFNSAVVALIGTTSSILCCTMAGYAFARFEFRGKKLLFTLVLLTTIMPLDYNIIPLFILVNKIKLANTHLGIALPNLVLPLGIFMVTQFARNIPRELLEAARIDGCSEYGILFRIAFPLLKPVIAILAVFSFFSSWDSFLWPVIAATRQESYTVPVGLAMLVSDRYYSGPTIMAGIVISLIPVLILFLFFQRRIVESNATTGLKG